MTTARVTDGALAIDRLVAAGPDTAAIDRFVSAHAVPVVEGTSCTFVFRGEADTVRLQHWIYGLPSSQPFQRLSGSDFWWLVLDLPEGSRFEYKIEVHRGDAVHWVRDPLNPLIAHDPFGANSVCHAAGYETPEWTKPDASVREGRLETHEIASAALGDTRRVQVYLPARYRATRRYPLLVVHDGSDYLRYAAFKTVLDTLIHRHEVAAMVVAFVDPVDRFSEYGASAAHARFVTDELVPHLEQELPLIARPEGRCLMGASLGGVASLHAAVTTPGFWGNLFLQSGSFAFTDIGDHQREPVFDTIVPFVNAFRRDPVAVSRRVFVSCGVYESLIYENRSLVPVLQRTGMEVRFEEARDGHNWENWRDRQRLGLSWLSPGPLWLMYE